MQLDAIPTTVYGTISAGDGISWNKQVPTSHVKHVQDIYFIFPFKTMNLLLIFVLCLLLVGPISWNEYLARFFCTIMYDI